MVCDLWGVRSSYYERVPPVVDSHNCIPGQNREISSMPIERDVRVMRKSNTIHAIGCLVVSFVLLGGCGSSSNPAAPSSSTVVRRVVVLGDSLAVTPTPADGFPAALQSRIAGGRLPWAVNNAGVYGDTTADGLRRYEPLARRYNIPLVPFLLTGVALTPGMTGPDGVHPNAAGARRIADNVWPYLEPLLR